MNQINTLNEDELIQLDELLIDYAHDDSLAIDEAHGYFTALIVANVDISDEDIIEAVLGQAAGKDKATLVALLIRMYHDLATELQAEQNFEPMVIEEEEENGESFEQYEGWCFGFILGMTDHEQHWSDLSKEAKNLVEPIATLALMREEELDMDDEEYSGWVELLPGSVDSLYHYFRQDHQD